MKKGIITGALITAMACVATTGMAKEWKDPVELYDNFDAEDYFGLTDEQKAKLDAQVEKNKEQHKFDLDLETHLGDADCDGDVDMSDVTAVLNYTVDPKRNPLTRQGYNNADVYQRGDGINSSDAALIAEYLAGKLHSLHGGMNGDEFYDKAGVESEYDEKNQNEDFRFNADVFQGGKIPNSEDAFRELSPLKDIEVPEDIVEVEEGAFDGCDQLKDATFWNRDTKFDGDAFGGNKDLTLHGYAGSTAEQQADEYGYKFEAFDPWNYYLLGDVNNDKVIDSSDASLVLSEYAKVSTGQSETFIYLQKKAADVNFDKAIDSTDASNILSYYAYTATGGADGFPTYLLDNNRVNKPERNYYYDFIFNLLKGE